MRIEGGFGFVHQVLQEALYTALGDTQGTLKDKALLLQDSLGMRRIQSIHQMSVEYYTEREIERELLRRLHSFTLTGFLESSDKGVQIVEMKLAFFAALIELGFTGADAEAILLLTALNDGYRLIITK